MAFTKLFDKDLLHLLSSLGYNYLVVEPNQLMAYARRDKTPEYALKLLGMKEFEISTIKPQQIAVFEMYTLEVTME